jgi:hypothetical protein
MFLNETRLLKRNKLVTISGYLGYLVMIAMTMIINTFYCPSNSYIYLVLCPLAAFILTIILYVIKKTNSNFSLSIQFLINMLILFNVFQL